MLDLKIGLGDPLGLGGPAISLPGGPGDPDLTPTGGLDLLNASGTLWAANDPGDRAAGDLGERGDLGIGDLGIGDLGDFGPMDLGGIAGGP